MNTRTLERLAKTSGFRATTPAVLLGIEDHKKFIASCPPELRNVFKSYIEEREDITGRWQHPIIAVPYLLNELFNISDASKLQTICSAFLACDHFTHLLDDLADEKRLHDKALLAHASHLMLSRGRRLYLNVASDINGFLDFFERYLAEAMQGEQWLWNRTQNSAPYHNKDFEMLRARGGMLNICLIAYCDATEQWKHWALLERAFNEVIVGIQLLDDVVDVEKDFQNNIYTMAVAAVIRDIPNDSPSWEMIAMQLLKGPRWKESIELAVEYLNRGRADLQSLRIPSICKVLNEIINASEEFAVSIDQAGHVDQKELAADRVAKILESPIVRAMSH